MAIHVTPHENGWQVKTSGKQKAYRVKPTQKEAIEVARTLAINQQSNVKIHGENGRIRDVRNYDNKNTN